MDQDYACSDARSVCACALSPAGPLEVSGHERPCVQGRGPAATRGVTRASTPSTGGHDVQALVQRRGLRAQRSAPLRTARAFSTHTANTKHIIKKKQPCGPTHFAS